MSSGPGIDQANSASTATFVTALVFNAAIFSIEIVAFTILRPYFKAIYEPRTYAPPKSRRIGTLTHHALLWPLAVLRADYRDIIKAQGLDPYFFVRFLRMLAIMFTPIWIVSWAVLLPVTSVNTQNGQPTGLDKLVFGNVAKDQQQRYAAHIILAFFFTFWIFYNIRKEMKHFVITRQRFLISAQHAKSVQARTLLITGVPAKYLHKAMLMKMFSALPGGVKEIWINRNLKDLPDYYDRRLKACNKLESAETKLFKTAAKLKLKEAKSGKKDVEASGDAAALVPKADRPSHKLGFLGLFGEKVDSIDWATGEIRLCNEKLDEGKAAVDQQTKEDESHFDGQEIDVTDGLADGTVEPEKRGNPISAVTEKVGQVGSKANAAVGAVKGRLGAGIGESYPPLNSVFIEFNQQVAVHLAQQSLLHHEPYRMTGKYVEVDPQDVIWSNLGLNPYEMKVRTAISWAVTAVIIIFWSFPVAFVGVISNIHSVCDQAVWLRWICTLPSVVVGIISGILPPVLLAVLTMLLPIVLRLLSRFEGTPQKSMVEYSLQNRFFMFQVIHSFLIVTLSAGIMKALPQLINNPTGIPSILAGNLPGASTFFLTFIILQGLAATAGGFLQIVPLVLYYVKLTLLGSTPRSIWGITHGKRAMAWGTVWPAITLLTTISFGYMIISPLINGLAWFTFCSFFFLYKYLFLWVFDFSGLTDTGGKFFPRAIQHLFVGLYVGQICLGALFFLAQDANGKQSAIPEGALMVVLVIFTIAFHIVINNSFDPLINALPLSLADKMYVTPQEERAAAEPSHTVDSDSVELHSKRHQGDETVVDAPQNSPYTVPKPVPEEVYGFAHPAASRPQRIVWTPRDRLGLADEEVRSLSEGGVLVSSEGAVMNEKGKVEVTGRPPDEVDEDEEGN